MSYDITTPVNPGDHVEGCPLECPWLRDPDEFPLECACDEYDDEAELAGADWLDDPA